MIFHFGFSVVVVDPAVAFVLPSVVVVVVVVVGVVVEVVVVVASVVAAVVAAVVVDFFSLLSDKPKMSKKASK